MKASTPTFPKHTVIVSCIICGLLGVILCGYGHAALSTNLLISGDATIEQSIAGFTSTYMQDVTPDECRKVENDATAQLVDKRDGRAYWISKMRDGSCWMTQDLKFDLLPDENGKIELTSELTDINPSPDNVALYEEEVKNGQTILKWNNQTSKFKPETTYFYKISAAGTSNNTAKSWHLQERVINNPLANKASYINLATGTSLADLVWSYTPSVAFANGVSHDDLTMTYNEHYLMGNYYQYNVASAGSRVNGQLSASSICPRGWTLPAYSGKEDANELGALPGEIMKSYASDAGKYVAWPFYFSEAFRLYNTSLDSSYGQNTGYWTSFSANYGGIIRAYTSSNTVTYTQASLSSLYNGYPVRCRLRM